MPAQLIILEGNISAGKTSLARDLEKLLDYQIFLEPTVTNPYLEKFYAGEFISFVYAWIVVNLILRPT